jgi:mannose-6-phosphate isomerase-like protein (cupin superfamily)
MTDTVRPRVFALSDQTFRANNPTSRSARIVTPQTTGSERLFAGVFRSEPGSVGGWSFAADDPAEGTITDGLPHLGVHDEVYLCLQGRVRLTWDEGELEFGKDDVVHFPAGFTYRSVVVSDEPAVVFYVMAPSPTWMMPLTD